MEVTKQHLIEIIHKIDKHVEELLDRISTQGQRIKSLELQNQELAKSSQDTQNKIKEYIQELEQIRNYYVNSNNNSR